MKIPKYWAKGTHEIRDSDGRFRSFTCWRWSDASVEDAREQARARAVEIARKFLYIRLCQRQECFRASLTPKPWRCGIAKPPSRFPYEGSEAEVECRKWETKYQLAASRYTTCKLVKQIGEGRMHPEAELVLSVHDRLSCLGEDRRLA